jgi:hypothetical protein
MVHAIVIHHEHRGEADEIGPPAGGSVEGSMEEFACLRIVLYGDSLSALTVIGFHAHHPLRKAGRLTMVPPLVIGYLMR